MHDQNLPATTQGFSITDMRDIAGDMAKSGLFAMKTTEQVFALMMICQSEGLHPVQAMKRYHIIEGKPSMRADAMQAEFMRMGGTVEWVRSDKDICEAIFSHPSSPRPFPVKLTLQEYIDSGVATCWNRDQNKMVVKDNWKKSPAAMLRARAISSGVRAVLPGVVAGIYTPEEVQDFDSLPAPQAPAANAAPPVSRGTAKSTPAPVPQAEPADFTPVTPTPTAAPKPTPAPQPVAPAATTPAVEPATEPTQGSLEIPANPEPITLDFNEQKRIFSRVGLLINSREPETSAALKADWKAATTNELRASVVAKALEEARRLGLDVNV